MLALNPGSAWPALSLQASERRPARSRVVAAAAPAVEALRAKSLQLEQFDAAAVAAAGEGARALLGEGVACDRTTLEWFARDRKLDVEKTAVKVLAYAQWRQAGFTGLTEADVAREAATGKAVLLADRDVLGRPVVLVRVALNKVDERDIVETERLCVFLMDRALQEGCETVLTVFDLRGFSTANADLPFIRFFIKLMFDIYPKRIGQVLLVGAPLIFQPLWQVVRPLLGKYASIVQFVSPKEADDYLPQSWIQKK